MRSSIQKEKFTSRYVVGQILDEELDDVVIPLFDFSAEEDAPVLESGRLGFRIVLALADHRRHVGALLLQQGLLRLGGGRQRRQRLGRQVSVRHQSGAEVIRVLAQVHLLSRVELLPGGLRSCYVAGNVAF